MKLLLLSEGPLDLGDPVEWDAAGKQGRPGPLRPLVKAILEAEWIDIETRPLGRGRAHGRFGHTPPGRHLTAHARVLLRELLTCVPEFEGVIAVEDEDRVGPKRLAELEKGRRAAGDATSRAPCAIGVARTMVESWLLGDPGACQRWLGVMPEGWPTDPEDAAGPRGTPTYPKTQLRTLLRDAGLDGTDYVEAYGSLAEHIDIDSLRRSCHRSFDPFAKDVEAEFRPRGKRQH